MSFTKDRGTQALFEILEIAKLDLHRLLVADHVPFDISDKIAKKRKTIADIEFLIYDIRVELALKDLKRQYMQTYSLDNIMNTLTI
jgi:hypothetical protein